MSKKRMNFIFFFPDEMRAESLSCYGHPIVKTPNMDKLAEEGVRFDKCFVQHTVCSPSRCSLMTGWYPHVAGHRTLWHLLRPHEPSLFRYLKEAGYHIEWHGKNDLYASESLPSSVDHFEGNVKKGANSAGAKSESIGTRVATTPTAKDGAPNYSCLRNPSSAGVYETSDMQKVQRGMEFLRSRKADDKPFMLYLPLGMPHPPYSAPEPYHSMYNPDELPPLRPANLSGKPDFYQLIREYRGLKQEPDELFKKIQSVYLGMISYSDWMLGELLNTLEETGLAAETTVIVASDHGDWAGDYGLVEKWPSGMDDTLTRVPLIIRTPEHRAGHVVEEQVELFDIMATVLDIAGINAKHSHFAQSLVPQLNGAPGDPKRAVFTEGGYDSHEPHCFEGYSGRRSANPGNGNPIYFPKLAQQQEHPDSVCRSTMIRTLEYKLIRRTQGVNELYDLQQDPLELANVYQDSAYAFARTELEFRLMDWYIHTSDAVPHVDDARGFPPMDK